MTTRRRVFRGPDLTGRTFERLFVIERTTFDGRKWKWRCRCACGSEVDVIGQNLVRGNTRSCGCFHSQRVKETFTTHGFCAEGPPKTEYRIWNCIQQRCQNPKNPNWPNYGGRGIRLCAQWQTFEGFFADVGPRPSPDLTLDRKDNNGDYEPGNVRWATQAEQIRNRRSSVIVEHAGEKLSVTEWGRRFGIEPKTLKNRLFHQKLSFEEATSRPGRKACVGGSPPPA
jgi:hypothetical protein